MGQFFGADPDQLDGLARQMGNAGDRLESIRQQITFWLDSSPWDGSDAEDFRHSWQHGLQNALHAAAAMAREGAEAVRRNAQQQRDASSDHGEGIFDGLERRHELFGMGKEAVEFVRGALRHELKDFPKLGELPADLRTRLDHLAAEFKAGVNEIRHAGPTMEAVRRLGRFAPVIGVVADLAFAASTIASPKKSGFQKGVAVADVAFDVAEVATAEVPPVAVALAGVHVAVDVGADLVTPEGRHELAEDAKDIATAAKTVVKIDEWEAKIVLKNGEMLANGVRGVLAHVF